VRRGTAARAGAAPRTREALPPGLVRELEGTARARARQAGERPTSIKDAIVRWLNEEL
jgi:hypothetical protein